MKRRTFTKAFAALLAAPASILAAVKQGEPKKPLVEPSQETITVKFDPPNAIITIGPNSPYFLSGGGWDQLIHETDQGAKIFFVVNVEEKLSFGRHDDELSKDVFLSKNLIGEKREILKGVYATVYP